MQRINTEISYSLRNKSPYDLLIEKKSHQGPLTLHLHPDSLKTTKKSAPVKFSYHSLFHSN